MEYMEVTSEWPVLAEFDLVLTNTVAMEIGC
jgi:hypothetical protein